MNKKATMYLSVRLVLALSVQARRLFDIFWNRRHADRPLHGMPEFGARNVVCTLFATYLVSWFHWHTPLYLSCFVCPLLDQVIHLVLLPASLPHPISLTGQATEWTGVWLFPTEWSGTVQSHTGCWAGHQRYLKWVLHILCISFGFGCMSVGNHPTFLLAFPFRLGRGTAWYVCWVSHLTLDGCFSNDLQFVVLLGRLGS